MRFVIGLVTVVLALAPYWLVVIAFKSKWIVRMWTEHGTVVSIFLAGAALLSRVLISIPVLADRDLDSTMDSFSSLVLSIDMLLMAPLEEFCYALAGRQTGIPGFAMITYGLVTYFVFYRMLGFLASGGWGDTDRFEAIDESRILVGTKP